MANDLDAQRAAAVLALRGTLGLLKGLGKSDADIKRAVAEQLEGLKPSTMKGNMAGAAGGATIRTAARLLDQDDNAWLTAAVDRGRVRLTRYQRKNNRNWARMQDAASSSLLQIGANVHETTTFRSGSGVYDVGPDCVALGWRRITLVEPMPQHFAKLSAKYEGRRGVRLVHGAVCDACGAPDNEANNMSMWYVDASNRTGNWGSRHADTRCLAFGGASGAIVPEIASFSRAHVLKHSRYFLSTAKTCRQCASGLPERPRDGVALPPDCLRNVIANNLRSMPVRCYCASELATLATRATRAQHERARTGQQAKHEAAVGAIANGARARMAPAESRRLTLLLIDAEGHDAQILSRFPFERVPVSRVTFEAQHLPNVDFRAAGEALQRHGFELVFGGFKAALSTWHHVNATI